MSVGTGATLIVEANTQRQSLLLYNKGPIAVALGPDSSITTSNTIWLNNASALSEDTGGTKVYSGPYYGIVGSGTVDVRFWERTR